MAQNLLSVVRFSAATRSAASPFHASANRAGIGGLIEGEEYKDEAVVGRGRNGSDRICKSNAWTYESCERAKCRILSAICKDGDVPETPIEQVEYSGGV